MGEIVNAGWLYRKSTFFRKWKKQWFVLLKTGELLYYDSPDSREPEDRRMMYAVCGGIRTGEQECHHKPPDGVPPSCLLLLEMRDVTGKLEDWKMCAESTDDLYTWKLVLTEAKENNPFLQQRQQPYQHTIHSGRAGDMQVNAPQYVVHAPAPLPTPIVVEDDPMMRHYNRRMERYYQSRYGTPFISGLGPVGSTTGMYGSGYF